MSCKKEPLRAMNADHEELLQELESIDAIYPGYMTVHTADSTIVSIKVPQHEYVTVQISFPADYPSKSSPRVMELRFDDDSRLVSHDAKFLLHLFQEVMDSAFYQNGRNAVCVFDFLTELDRVLYTEPEQNDRAVEKVVLPTDPFEHWYASQPITDRGSTFMGFATRVSSETEAFQRLETLKTDSKIRKGSHAMCAWRIKQRLQDDKREIIFQDSDDDGETAAGSRMLHLITIMDVWNVMVVVVRWFNGAHLGPDRFKHINSAAREAVLNAGF
ncbi:hypothetical protein HG536_0A08990 [Torulaspora globosa]|uniref:RWD domain-containing protein n=1 Tax=Torulaspora globosa TaxID=48254 RepID=A0A7G3ZC46_9SACH|nr:uncharacterized protein HG536_0A08990 [Torulaspora globosa]QLL31082.1 hypothetical protein HG536_0A08990 [Torulaspora globosa]